MKEPRLRVLVPSAIVLTMAVPALRGIPLFDVFPDPWLIFILATVAVPTPESLRRPVSLVVWCALLRACVSAASFFAGLAGLGLALVVRHHLHRRVSSQDMVMRLMIGRAAAVPLAVFDARSATLMGVDISYSVLVWRVVWSGVFWAFFLGQRIGKRWSLYS